MANKCHGCWQNEGNLLNGHLKDDILHPQLVSASHRVSASGERPTDPEHTMLQVAQRQRPATYMQVSPMRLPEFFRCRNVVDLLTSKRGISSNVTMTSLECCGFGVQIICREVNASNTHVDQSGSKGGGELLPLAYALMHRPHAGELVAD